MGNKMLSQEIMRLIKTYARATLPGGLADDIRARGRERMAWMSRCHAFLQRVSGYAVWANDMYLLVCPSGCAYPARDLRKFSVDALVEIARYDESVRILDWHSDEYGYAELADF